MSVVLELRAWCVHRLAVKVLSLQGAVVAAAAAVLACSPAVR